MKTIFESPNGKLFVRDGISLWESRGINTGDFLHDVANELERLQAAQDKAALYDAGFDDAKRLRAANAKLRAACEAWVKEADTGVMSGVNLDCLVITEAALAETAGSEA